MAPKKVEKKDEKKAEKKVVSPELKALLEKERALEKVHAPDRTEYDAECEKAQKTIAELQEKRQKLDEKIAAKSVGKEDHNKARDAIRTKLNEYAEQIDKLEQKKAAMQGSIKSKQQEGRERRQELNDMKKKLGYESEADIDQKIRDIEFEMQTESFSLKEEKARLVQISELRKAKPLVTKYAKMEGIDTTGDVTGLKSGVDAVFAELKELREAKKVQSAALAKLNEARQKVLGDVPGLFTEREQIKAQIREQFQKKNELRDAFNNLSRGYNAYMNDVRQLRGERARIERAQREAEWQAARKAEKEAEGPPPAPYMDELLELGSMLTHFKSLLPKDAEKENTEEKNLEVTAGKDQLVLMSKDQRDEEFFFAPTKKKNLRKKGGGGKSKTIVHAIETLAACDKYKVTTPNDGAGVAAAMKQVETQIEAYKEKQKKALDKKEKKEEKKEEAAPDADVVAPEQVAVEA